MLAVSEKDLTKLLHSLNHTKCCHLLQNLSTALAAFSAQRKTADINIHQPARTSIVSEKWSSTTLFMPVSDHASTGFKVVTVPKVSTPTNGIRGVINLLSPEGRLEGVMSAAEITAFRTALASMIPFTRFRAGGLSEGGKKKRVLIFGSGKQAEWHARLALLTVPNPTDIEGITFVNRSQQRLEESISSTLVPDLRARYPHLEINAYSREELEQQQQEQEEGGEDAYKTRLRADLASSDAIFCCTPSTEPLFIYDDLTPKRRYISLIGSYKPHMQEVDSKTLLSGNNGLIYVDSVEACMEEAGELIIAKVDEKQLIELGELDFSTAGSFEGEGNVVFKCVGMGIMDLVIARSLLGMAREQGLGTVVEGF
ncbi:proline utilization protein [Talaromyces pinophilus]|uniref:Proline utilization protein n=1 Tax=Talaromyces pinophilus TaxID=128442 RepID=A0A6V8HP44_TALPI|nr:proline utilization protein [Talaromyces pinophilus]